MGVEHISIVNPKLRKGYIAPSTGFQQTESGIFAVPETPIRIDLTDVFAEFDGGPATT